MCQWGSRDVFVTNDWRKWSSGIPAAGSTEPGGVAKADWLAIDLGGELRRYG
ncbi:hypothetical protein B0H19DRAFT_1141681 [Mycena capillaripes]|nr:hypothetical protein B0H19DRAFT_1141681 [Mycena capillaripes]